MKVVLLYTSGFGDYTIQLANKLADYVDLTLIQAGQIYEGYQQFLNPKIQVKILRNYRIRDPRNLFTMAEMMNIIWGINPDLLHVQETN
ncbi:MAG: glycosyltransferase family 1 protein, partial [Sphaerospermopsis sp. SIO1G2]|nr:glycosyltransferase family 1 protein [Sphaerospermopsis sp. SIO1G2]